MSVCTICAFLHDGFVNINDVLKVLFERLRLHERCENKKLPRTLNRQQSTSEAAVQYPKRVGINVSTHFNSFLPPLRSYPCSCCSCRICTLCQRSSWSTGRSETRNLLKVNPNLRATNLQSVTYRFIRSSRRLWMGSSHA